MGVVVALVVGVPTFLVAWVPRQRLYYSAPPPTPLLASGVSGVATDLKIYHGGRRLADPYLLEVKLTAWGRRDIPSSAFDQDRPLVFDLGAEVVKVLQVRCSPVSSLTPPVAHEGSTLRVGPELISRRQTTTISVLVDGACPSLVCTQPVLAQVTVIPRDPSDRFTWLVTLTTLGAMTVFWVVMALTWTVATGAVATAATVVAVAAAVVFSIGGWVMKRKFFGRR
ncbi:MAG: hypothetical protein M3460_23165 [Actinomycetota bacterium]|nr:hypothetical protein [Actinomycetota bacterium]